ncbi:MAG: gluconate 2-dehydrogenase subunit 3 family protein [Pseudomonadota bacterium]
MDRRTFLIQTTGTIAAMSTPSLAASTSLTPDEWQTLAAVQEHLFPSEPDSPGAKDINATAYLDFVLAPVEREFIKNGVLQLEKMAQSIEGKQFIALSSEQRERLLRRFETKGKRWISTILRYILEALLTDPIYGGNPNAIGWKWLDHQPGFPRPPANKRYYLL